MFNGHLYLAFTVFTIHMYSFLNPYLFYLSNLLLLLFYLQSCCTLEAKKQHFIVKKLTAVSFCAGPDRDLYPVFMCTDRDLYLAFMCTDRDLYPAFTCAHRAQRLKGVLTAELVNRWVRSWTCHCEETSLHPRYWTVSTCFEFSSLTCVWWRELSCCQATNTTPDCIHGDLSTWQPRPSLCCTSCFSAVGWLILKCCFSMYLFMYSQFTLQQYNYPSGVNWALFRSIQLQNFNNLCSDFVLFLSAIKFSFILMKQNIVTCERLL